MAESEEFLTMVWMSNCSCFHLRSASMKIPMGDG